MYVEITDYSVTVFTDNSNYKASGQLKKGAIVECEESQGNWIKITKVSNGNRYYSGVVDGMYFYTNGVGGLVYKTVDNPQDEAQTGDQANEDDDDTVYIDDEMLYSYSSLTNDNQYMDTLKNGLRITNLNGILGLPHQFLPETDLRIDSGFDVDSIGRVYAEKIVNPIPLLLLTPGVPHFMSSFRKGQKKTLLQHILGGGAELAGFDDLLESGNGKYYSLKFSYIEYFKYVNAMLRSAAYFLGIQNVKYDGKKLGSLNWFYSRVDSGSDIFDNHGLSKYLGTYAGCIALYVEAETSTSDDFSNSTTESSLASAMNGLSDQARELNFLIGNVAGNIGAGSLYDKYISSESMTQNIENTTDTISSLLGKGNILSNITSKAQTLLAGGRMIFPEIWSDSSFYKSYNCKLKLVSPSGDKKSIFFNILVPIFHILALVLPRNVIGSAQAYYSPFLVRGFYKGIFNIDMGIITDLSITKGSDCEWSLDGLPTVAEVSFTIKDLYNGLAMSTQEAGKDKSILSNTAELDYIANTCGININEPDLGRTIKMYIGLGFTSKIKDKITLNIFGNFTQFINNKLQSIFGRF